MQEVQEGKDFIVNADGSVTSKNYQDPVLSPEQEKENALEAEYSDLVYDMSHPERFSDAEMAAKKERREALDKTLGKDKHVQYKNGKMRDAAARMREKLRAQMQSQQQQSPSMADIVSQQKQNG